MRGLTLQWEAFTLNLLLTYCATLLVDSLLKDDNALSESVQG